jgi:hypothetical protein
MGTLERLEGKRMDLALRLAARAESLEALPAPEIEQDLGHDAAGGIPRAEEEHIVGRHL